MQILDSAISRRFDKNKKLLSSIAEVTVRGSIQQNVRLSNK